MLCFIITFYLIHFYANILIFLKSFWGSSGITIVAIADILDKMEAKKLSIAVWCCRMLYEWWEVFQWMFATEDSNCKTGLKDDPFWIMERYKFLKKAFLWGYPFEGIARVNFYFRPRLRWSNIINSSAYLYFQKHIKFY